MRAKSEKPAFELLDPNGRKYEIFANGETRGFDQPGVVINRIPALIAEARGEGFEAGRGL